ncbi:MAG: hypothetical protein U9N03_02125 [Candidatus Caldatribacteriota bacterium]|nr:hypothetical protein [Candidatus Caldatribacteriota bacterium]
MKDSDKTKEQLLYELTNLRKKNVELEDIENSLQNSKEKIELSEKSKIYFPYHAHEMDDDFETQYLPNPVKIFVWLEERKIIKK